MPNKVVYKLSGGSLKKVYKELIALGCEGDKKSLKTPELTRFDPRLKRMKSLAQVFDVKILETEE